MAHGLPGPRVSLVPRFSLIRFTNPTPSYQRTIPWLGFRGYLATILASMSKQTSLNSQTYRVEIPNHGISTKAERCRYRTSLSRLDPPLSDQTLQDSFPRVYISPWPESTTNNRRTNAVVFIRDGDRFASLASSNEARRVSRLVCSCVTGKVRRLLQDGYTLTGGRVAASISPAARRTPVPITAVSNWLCFSDQLEESARDRVKAPPSPRSPNFPRLIFLRHSTTSCLLLLAPAIARLSVRKLVAKFVEENGFCRRR